MNSLDALRELLVPNILKDLVNIHGKTCARLKENSPHAKLKQIDILGVPANSILIKLDEYAQPSTLFKNDKGQRKRCDYILFFHIQNQGIVLFIELKSNKVKNPEVIRQFKGSECVLDYCNATLKRFHNHDTLLENFSKRFIVFYKPRISKKRTRPMIKPNNTIPENALKYPATKNISLKSIIAL
ncbi:MAG: hypothetical protein CSA81_01825 [Acidobacteria bacterium]|nr:MAG: hypothetical protein CSA81_01825 [Acidobacteriota bacterium]